MKSSPLVSIIMNCYNGEKYLYESVNSIINQTYKNWELIFWDNSSSKKCFKIIKKFNDTRIKYFFYKKKLKLYSSRNLALKKCKGDFISFLDQDDTWEKEKLEKQLALFKNKKIGLVYSNFWKLNENSFFKKKLASSKNLPTGFITNKLLKSYNVGLLTIMVRKKFLKNTKKIFNPEFNMLADFIFVLNFSLKYKFECVQEPLATYRYHLNQMSFKYLNISIYQHQKWISTDKEVNKFKTYKEFHSMSDKIKFMQLVGLIKKSKNFIVLKKIFSYPNNIYKIKLLLKFFIPKMFFSNLFGNLY